MISLQQLYRSNNTTTNNNELNNLILNKLDELINQTEINIKNSAKPGKDVFRLKNFKKAYNSIKNCHYTIESGKDAQKLPGVGKGIATRINEILATKDLKELKMSPSPLNQKDKIIKELCTVTGIGPVRAEEYYNNDIISVEELIMAVNNGWIEVTHHIEIGLKYYHDFLERIMWVEINEMKNIMTKLIHDVYPELTVEVCGSFRRELKSSGDMDVLITCEKPVEGVNYLTKVVQLLQKGGFIIDDLTSNGNSKYMGVCVHPVTNKGRRLDIRFIDYDSYYCALLYFTGSKECNVLMRQIAIENGMKLSEYSLEVVETGEKIVIESEKDVFDTLGVEWLKPCDRELN